MADLVGALFLSEHDLPEGALSEHFDEVEVIQRDLPAAAPFTACTPNTHQVTSKLNAKLQANYNPCPCTKILYWAPIDFIQAAPSTTYLYRRLLASS